MKSSFLKLSLLCVFSTITFLLVAQRDEIIITPYNPFVEYLDPCNPTFAPIPTSIQNANVEAANNSESTGFLEAFFSKSELISILNSSNCVGIRFYNALDRNNYGVVAVGVNSSGGELNQYLFSQIPQGETIVSRSILADEARVYVESLINQSGIIGYSVFFPKTSLNNILAEQGCSGVKLMPAERQFETNGNGASYFKTMNVLGVNENLTPVSNCLTSQEPCPTVCPNDNLLLTPVR